MGGGPWAVIVTQVCEQQAVGGGFSAKAAKGEKRVQSRHGNSFPSFRSVSCLSLFFVLHAVDGRRPGGGCRHAPLIQTTSEQRVAARLRKTGA
ncbi:uncharacterized protein BDZ83DRAFT_266657 [Colletotrichum acutatum]|uniref:Uncharacterized protein n=1 Tax=Glomerella acutata TaxID=27357 RepID=A0AAD8XJC1_GLOAC|nr:uncharacterized protein BDZ83DRAFT_266657 [Colletotrichum acutatum]KAK1726195.1 hypothetical protein BDZ83DRAFT_266657 [Colletotrichum acutatum]